MKPQPSRRRNKRRKMQGPLMDGLALFFLGCLLVGVIAWVGMTLYRVLGQPV